MLPLGSSFTYQDILDELIVYTQSGAAAQTDEFGFSITDGLYTQTGRLQFSMELPKQQLPTLAVNRGLQLPAGMGRGENGITYLGSPLEDTCHLPRSVISRWKCVLLPLIQLGRYFKNDLLLIGSMVCCKGSGQGKNNHRQRYFHVIVGGDAVVKHCLPKTDVQSGAFWLLVRKGHVLEHLTAALTDSCCPSLLTSQKLALHSA